jgi:hypothetical protein
MEQPSVSLASLYLGISFFFLFVSLCSLLFHQNFRDVTVRNVLKLGESLQVKKTAI